ncbi:hypothetical protein EYF80_035776 [Liparis tanakae]|uniref:Uncharacterized protein n=1 Tax=Liparis tanakae TaxID=230148 RepID=A0A4Z2GKA8_9TELE|nr:hypothetical protein EYF80_035776 [Liparis tanakae]
MCAGQECDPPLRIGNSYSLWVERAAGSRSAYLVLTDRQQTHQAPNRPSGLCSSKPGVDLAFLVRLFGTRVALFCGGGTSGGGWDSTPVFAPYPIIESCMLFRAPSTKCLTHEELGVKNLGSQFDVAGKPENPVDKLGRLSTHRVGGQLIVIMSWLPLRSGICQQTSGLEMLPKVPEKGRKEGRREGTQLSRSQVEESQRERQECKLGDGAGQRRLSGSELISRISLVSELKLISLLGEEMSGQTQRESGAGWGAEWGFLGHRRAFRTEVYQGSHQGITAQRHYGSNST